MRILCMRGLGTSSGSCRPLEGITAIAALLPVSGLPGWEKCASRCHVRGVAGGALAGFLVASCPSILDSPGDCWLHQHTQSCLPLLSCPGSWWLHLQLGGTSLDMPSATWHRTPRCKWEPASSWRLSATASSHTTTTGAHAVFISRCQVSSLCRRKVVHLPPVVLASGRQSIGNLPGCAFQHF